MEIERILGSESMKKFISLFGGTLGKFIGNTSLNYHTTRIDSMEGDSTSIS